MTTVWLEWAPKFTTTIRTAYDAMGIGETLQANIPVDVTGKRCLVGSSVLTLDGANELREATKGGTGYKLTVWAERPDDWEAPDGDV